MEKPAPDWRTTLGAGIFVMYSVVSFAIGSPEQFLEFAIVVIVITLLAVPVFAAWAILQVVRWINRRDDPRLAKRPHGHLTSNGTLSSVGPPTQVGRN